MTLGVLQLTLLLPLLSIVPSANIWANNEPEAEVRPNNTLRSCPRNTCNITQMCSVRLKQTALYGYPWFPTTSSNNILVGDSVDPIQRVCAELYEYKECLSEHGIGDYCLIVCSFPVNAFYLKTTFEFMCENNKVIGELMRSLQCLHSNRLLSVIMFRIGHTHGPGFLNQVVQRWKTFWFNILNIKPAQYNPAVPPLFCMTTEEIAVYVRPVIVSHCGDSAATLVEDYLSRHSNHYQDVMEKVGFNHSLCEAYNAESEFILNMSTSIQRLQENPMIIEFIKMADRHSKGTALKTVYGQMLLQYLKGRSGKYCTRENLYLMYSVGILASDELHETSRFNILHFAHPLFSWLPHGTQCARVSLFRELWENVKSTCGPQARGYEHHFTLFVNGCSIQEKMDQHSCPWQDILFRYYIAASDTTVWPVFGQPPGDPMWLDRALYSGPKLANNLPGIFDILEPGIKEIAKRCGEDLSGRLMKLYSKLNVTLHDAIPLYEWVNEHSDSIFDWWS